MSVEKVYYFDYEKYFSALEELYPIKGMGCFDVSNLTSERLDKLMEVLYSVVSNVKSRAKEVLYDVDEEITCLSEQAKVSFDNLFANKDLILYGHGGAAEQIMKSGKFVCRYFDLGSHFVGLEKSNECLSKLNAWPHRGHTQIAILALNIHECNPIYIDNTQVKGAIDNYEIPIEYFAGWYDAKSEQFIPNPSFKVNHSYNSAATIYPEQEKFIGMFRGINISDKLVNDFIYNLDLINYLLTHSSIKGLSLNGLIGVQEQLLNCIKKAYYLQAQFTPEYLDKLKSSGDELVNSEGASFDWADLAGWDDWDDEPEPEPKGR